MQIETLNDICEDMSVKISYQRNPKQLEVRLNLLYEPPSKLGDIFNTKKPERLAVIKNGYIFFEDSKKTSSKDINFKGLTKRGFRDRITNSKIILLENKIKDIDDKISQCTADIKNAKSWLDTEEQYLSELKTAKKLLTAELKTLKEFV